MSHKKTEQGINKKKGAYISRPLKFKGVFHRNLTIFHMKQKKNENNNIII